MKLYLILLLILPVTLLHGTGLDADTAVVIMDADSGRILRLDNPGMAVEKSFPPGSLIKLFPLFMG